MQVYRLSRLKHSNHLSGKGAALAGGRWNSKGTEIIYSSENRSLAMAEVAVHLTLATIPDDYVMLTIDIPANIKIQTYNKSLPPNWNIFPYNTNTQAIGDRFVLEGKYCILKVPSAVTPGDHNYLINPAHPDFLRIKIIKLEKFPFDKRIFS